LPQAKEEGGMMRSAFLRTRAAGWLALAVAALLPAVAWASCIPVAEQPGRFIPAAYKTAELPSGTVKLTYIGHATFLIETSGGATAVTDFNGYVRPALVPDIATMNNAHSTHYTDFPDAGIKFVLPGWGTAEKPVQYNFTHLDLHVYNVQTNVRDWGGGTRINGNSIFVFETAGLCIAHLGHLHHSLTAAHLAMLGKVDVLLVPVDGALTMGQFDMIEVIQRIKAPLVIPMHFFSAARLARFIERLQAETNYNVRTSDVPEVMVSAAMLPSPSTPQLLVLPGH
jgi:L-ascorbate metabolism protein UlaG (beta-lactamase superfamily)